MTNASIEIAAVGMDARSPCFVSVEVETFKINGCSKIKETHPSSIASRTWTTVGGYDWKMEFFACTDRIQHECWLKLRISWLPSVSKAAAAFSCCLLDDPNSTKLPSREMVSASMFHRSSSAEEFLMSMDKLERSRYLNGDSFHVRCMVAFLTPVPEKGAIAAAADDEDLRADLGEMLRSQTGADVTFLVAGETLAAHRSILSARSPVFKAELYGGMRETSSRCVEVEDMDADVFRALLRFVYTGASPELEQPEEEQATEMAHHLLAAADRYGLERLKAICEEKLCAAISVDTVATSLALAEQHGCSKLRARCMEFVVVTPANLNAVAETESYKDLLASCPSVLTDLLKLMVNRSAIVPVID